jgi:hypothetical protein
MVFWFEFLNIQMNEKTITCHDCDGFKWQNINIYQILIVFICSPMPFLTCWNVTAPYFIPLCFDLIIMNISNSLYYFLCLTYGFLTKCIF